MAVPGTHADRRFERLVGNLAADRSERTWLEFKENNADPNEIGEYISALANAAALDGEARAYVVWGVRDTDHQIVGTTFDPAIAKGAGNEDLEPWLVRLLSPQHEFRFEEGDVLGSRVVTLTIEPALSRPVQFKGTEYIRIGSYKKQLKDHPDHERRLWRRFDDRSLEDGTARDDLSGSDALDLLDHESYFAMSGRVSPTARGAILEGLQAAGLARLANSGTWEVTNLGALAFARDINDFPHLSRKALRVIQYAGNSRVRTVRETLETRGYAVAFQGMNDLIVGLLPTSEVIDRAIRRTQPLFPEIAIRELLANALIHQDLSIRGAGPVVELFENRIEITNPGVPLIDPRRFVDSPPQSRNEKLGKLMRLLGVCEERGTGWDKIALEVELHQLPAPSIDVPEQYTRVILLGPQQLKKMPREDRVRALYLHACLRYVTGEQMTNSTVRERFQIAERNKSAASRLIKEGIEAGMIMAHDPSAGPRSLHYVPFWAAGD